MVGETVVNSRWKDGDANAAQVVIKRLNKTLTVNPDHSVSLGEPGDIDAAVRILVASANFSKDISDRERARIMYRAVVDSKKNSSLRSPDLEDRISRMERTYLSQPLQPFILLTSLSVRYSEMLAAVKFKGVTIVFLRFPPSQFELPESIARRGLRPYPVGYSVVKVRVTGRDPYSAGDRALANLDLLRGLWNLNLNLGRWRFSSGDGRKCVNEIVPGPIHTIHVPSGKAATDEYWFEPDFDTRVNAVALENKYRGVKKFESWARKQLQLCPYGMRLQKLIIRYTRALDERNLTNAFLRIWSLLEDLTATQMLDHKATARRAARLFPNNEYSRLVLNNLRSFRNRIVHESHETDQAEGLVYEAKGYAETMLRFLLRYHRLFSSLEEVGYFLDLPIDRKALRTGLRHRRFALELDAG